MLLCFRLWQQFSIFFLRISLHISACMPKSSNQIMLVTLIWKFQKKLMWISISPSLIQMASKKFTLSLFNPFRQKINSVKNMIWNESVFCKQGKKVKNVLVSYVVTQTIIKDMSHYKLTGKKREKKKKNEQYFFYLAVWWTHLAIISYCLSVNQFLIV